jgi:hypothetical protein
MDWRDRLHAWWRRRRGGHWELVDFDRLSSQFTGRIWMRMDQCSRDALSFHPQALVRCEEHGRVVYGGEPEPRVGYRDNAGAEP